MITKSKFLTTTRVTGFLYLGLAITGVIAFLFIKSNIYVDGNAKLTNTNLMDKQSLARVGIAVELLLVAFQAMVSIWFYKLFCKVNSFSAIMLLVFGVVNAVAILIAAATWLVALNAAVAGVQKQLVFYFFNLHESIWTVGGIFFGLWLLPMGYLATKAKMPRILAIILGIGGVGYILSVLVLVLFPQQKLLAEVLPVPATIGEFWMIGYLLIKSRLNTEEE